jgi:hypothetical protein
VGDPHFEAQGAEKRGENGMVRQKSRTRGRPMVTFRGKQAGSTG